MADKPGDNRSKLLSFTVGTGDSSSPIADTYQVKKIEIKKELNRIPVATFEIIDGSVAEGDFEVSEKDDFKPGVKIEVKAGYESSENETSIFKGIIVKHSIKVTCEETLLILECKDEAVKLTKNRINGYFEKMTDSAIMTKVLSDNYSGTTTVEATTLQHERVIQYYSTPWDFVISRAEQNGKLLMVDDGTITINAPKASAAAVLDIKYGDDIEEFDGEINAESQYSSVESVGYSIADQDMGSPSASEKPSVPKQGNLDSSTLASVLKIKKINLQTGGTEVTDQLKAWANSCIQKSWLSRMRGHMTIQGHAKAKPGAIVNLEGLGDRFNGNAFLSKTEHKIESGDWKTTCHFGVSEEWFYEDKNISSPPASGMLPGMSGLHVGKVLAYEEDPLGEIRVKVKVPVLQDSKNTLWARLATMYATTAKGGTFFIPEKDDEVILGFINDDPRFPVILGSVYSSVNKPPFDLSADNYQKAIITKGQCKITFDDEKKTIEITTPKENKITITDDSEGSITITDQTKNSIKMSSGGVDIVSKKGMTINVQEDLSISAKGKISISATSDGSFSGANMSLTAKASMKASGSASAEYSSSGSTTIKGALVAIN